MTKSKHMLYVVGVPGAGKTTVVQRLTKGCPAEQKRVPYVYYTEYAPGVVQLGWEREQFGGTDSLGMAAQKHVIAWLEEEQPRFVLAEGDRLANGKFFEAAIEMGYSLEVALLSVSETGQRARLKRRNAEIGKAQDDRWLATRTTKVNNLVKKYMDITIEHDTNDLEPKEIARELAATPVGKAIRRSRKIKT